MSMWPFRPLLEFTRLDHLPYQPSFQTEERSGGWSEEWHVVREGREGEKNNAGRWTPLVPKELEVVCEDTCSEEIGTQECRVGKGCCSQGRGWWTTRKSGGPGPSHSGYMSRYTACKTKIKPFVPKDCDFWP